MGTDVKLMGVDSQEHPGQRAYPEISFVHRKIQNYHRFLKAPALALISAFRFSDSREGLDSVLDQFDYLLVYSYDSDIRHEPTGWRKMVGVDKGHTQAALFKRE